MRHDSYQQLGFSGLRRLGLRRGLAAAVTAALVASFALGAFAASPNPTISPMCTVRRDGPERAQADNGHSVPTESDLVQSSVLLGDVVYFGGPFTSVESPGEDDGVDRRHLAACSLSTGALLPWNPGTNGYMVWDLATDGSKIFVSGEFTEIGGVPRPGLAALDPQTGAVLDWTPPPIVGDAVLDLKPQPINRGRVQALAISGRTMYFGGTFNQVGGQERTGVAAVDTIDGSLKPWAPRLIKGTEVQYNTAPIEVRALTVWRDRVIAAGIFSEEGIPGNPDDNGNNRLGHVTAVDATTGAQVPWESKPEYPVFGLASNANYVYWAGAGKGPPRNDIAQLDPATGKMGKRHATDGNVQSLWATDDIVYVAGHFDNIVPDEYASVGEEKSLAVRGRVLAARADTLELLDWSPKTDRVGDGTWSIRGDGSSLIIGGEFKSVEGESHQGLAKYSLHFPYIRSVSPSSLDPAAATQTVTVQGANFASSPTVSFGPGIVVQSVSFVSPSRLDVTIAAAGAALGPRDVKVTNPDGALATCGGCVAVGAAVPARPTVPGPIGDGNPVVPLAPGPGGYWLAASDGGIFAFGDAVFNGSTGAMKLNKPIVGMARTPSGKGYWLVASDGGIFSFGDAVFKGSTGAIKLNEPIVGMSSTPSGQGYWLVASDGGIFSFGDAVFKGSTGAMRLNQPIVGMAPTPSGKGYWLVASDGGIFSFGDAVFKGSTGAIKLNKPIEGMAATPTGQGYWLVASDGGIFAFGDAAFKGSTGAIKLNKPIEGMAATPTGQGYWLVASDGGIFSFGDAGFKGSTGAIKLNQPIVGLAPS